jgi:polyhydroxyalkanoate synthase
MARDDPRQKVRDGDARALQEIGVETGATPREVVWSRNKTRLYRYRRPGSAGERRGGEASCAGAPGLRVRAQALRPRPRAGNSLVEYLVGEGFDVYMLDFGISGAEDAGLTLEDFVLDYMHGAVDKVVETSGAGGVSLFGQSQGGTLCAMYASLFPEGPVKNLVLLSAPTEFAPRNPGPLGLWTHASRNGGTFFDPAVVPLFFGNLPTDLASSFINTAASLQATGVGMAARSVAFGLYDAALREVRALAGRDVSLRSWLAVSKWVDDAAPFPGETFSRWVRDFYQRDRLVKGQVELAGAGWTSRTSGAPCSTSWASGTTWSRPPRPKPRPSSPAAGTRSRSRWTPGTSGCWSGPVRRTCGPGSGTGSRPAPSARGGRRAGVWREGPYPWSFAK